MDHGPRNPAVLRHMAITAVQKEVSKDSLKGKFKPSGGNDPFLFRLLEIF